MGFRKNRHEEIIWPKHLELVKNNTLTAVEASVKFENTLTISSDNKNNVAKNALVELPKVKKLTKKNSNTKKSTHKNTLKKSTIK